MTTAFKHGDPVTWTSQSAGYTKTKSGFVTAVVPVGCYPDRTEFPQLYRGAGVGLKRDHVSYVVRVPSTSGRGAGTLYWPRAAALAATAGQGDPR